MRRSYGDNSFDRSDPNQHVAVEIVSAELAQDGGPAPDVRCTIAQRVSGGTSPRVASTSVCQQAWSPVWKEMLRVELDQGPTSTRLFDLVLWDESAQAEGGEPSCLGELVIFTFYYWCQMTALSHVRLCCRTYTFSAGRSAGRFAATRS
jgi:hypothetical protein